MIEDKLSWEERVRLEALCQANMATPPGASAEHILDKAAKFEEFLKNGKKA